jgi:hypothetical protein
MRKDFKCSLRAIPRCEALISSSPVLTCYLCVPFFTPGELAGFDLQITIVKMRFIQRVVHNEAMKNDPPEIYGWRAYLLACAVCALEIHSNMYFRLFTIYNALLTIFVIFRHASAECCSVWISASLGVSSSCRNLKRMPRPKFIELDFPYVLTPLTGNSGWKDSPKSPQPISLPTLSAHFKLAALSVLWVLRQFQINGDENLHC